MQVKKAESSFTEPDMTPMIDIVFQLLTFFMIAINFENTKADERVKLPVDSLAKPPDTKLDEELMLNVGYDRTRAGVVQGGPYIFYNDEKLTLDRIAPKLEQEAKIFRAKAKNPEKALEEVAVLIRADAAVPTGLVQELIEKCQEAKFTKFSLKASQEEK